MLQLAIEREFEIIGEFLFRLVKVDPDKLAERISEYRKIIDFRNILAHGYDSIDVDAVWNFVQNQVPEFWRRFRIVERILHYIIAA